jgi:hypothetical protein
MFQGSGGTAMCWSTILKTVSACSSSIRYKTEVQAFTPGLELINRLRPVRFTWRATGERDLGFIAEEVNEVEPLLTVFNTDGQVEGVKYAQITTVLVNAVKEQQAQIEAQATRNQELQDRLRQQQQQIDSLKAAICAANPTATVCQPARP